MAAHGAQPGFATRALPTGCCASSRRDARDAEHPSGMEPSLCLDDGPSCVVQDHDMGALRLERFGGNGKHASANLGYEDLPTPLQAAHVAVAQSRIDGEQDHPL